jgi:hypothetical protein
MYFKLKNIFTKTYRNALLNTHFINNILKKKLEIIWV